MISQSSFTVAPLTYSAPAIQGSVVSGEWTKQAPASGSVHLLCPGGLPFPLVSTGLTLALPWGLHVTSSERPSPDHTIYNGT